jgi:hypothetical protein
MTIGREDEARDVRLLIQPFLLTFEGGDADYHSLDAHAVGESILGASKLYTGIAHYVAFGIVPRGNYRRSFRCYSKPATAASWDQLFYVAPILGAYSLHAALYNEAIGFLFGKVANTVLSVWKRPGETAVAVEKLAETITQMSADNRAIVQQMTQGLVTQHTQLACLHENLLATLPIVAGALRPAGRELVAPVGPSCRTMKQFADSPTLVEIVTEAEADVIRGDEDTEVDDMKQFRILRVSEINLRTGHCILEVDGFPLPVPGTITDPALKQPKNLYTNALHTHTGLMVDAKPVRKGAETKRLYVSNAAPLNT